MDILNFLVFKGPVCGTRRYLPGSSLSQYLSRVTNQFSVFLRMILTQVNLVSSIQSNFNRNKSRNNFQFLEVNLDGLNLIISHSLAMKILKIR